MKATETIAQKFEQYILGDDHPCVMAQSMFRSKNHTLKTYSEMNRVNNSIELLKDLTAYIERSNKVWPEITSFIAVFEDEQIDTELEFEIKLWGQLSMLVELDELPWNIEVERDQESSNFGMSVAGEAFFIVGLHPKSSRAARQAPYTAMVFNLHSQFDKLRTDGVFHKVRDTIRQRDKAKNGSINPMMSDFGESTEALQYSGRKNESGKCPFNHVFNK